MMKIYLSILLLAIALLGDASGYKYKKRAAGVRGVTATRRQRTPPMADSRHLKMLQSHAMHGAPRSSEGHMHA
jgi:hypothetical protein